MAVSDGAEERLGRFMAGAQAGDAEAYLALLTAITPTIRQWIRKRRGFLGDADVEDVLQDVLLSLHAVRATYDPARPFAPWLAAIVRHRLVDAARRYGRQGSHEVRVDDPDVTFSLPAANSQEEYGDSEALAHAIDALPRRQRQAIELLKMQELSLKEASAATGLSIGALKLATHRAMTSLRRSLHARNRHED
ncbi:MAG: sigma-70 family RNA polymerase sigma factor [Vicinamibacterales bacterium]